MSLGEVVSTERDHRRRSFLGLALANVGLQPWVQVVGPYLTLLVASRTTSALAVTFALAAHRGATWLVLPVVGWISDRTTSKAGRRVPFIVGGMALAAVGVFFFTRTSGYWQLVGCIAATRTAVQVSTLARVGVTPDVFGRSRWAKAAGAIAVAGVLSGIFTLGVIRGTWRQDDPSTWTTTFLLASGGLALGALIVGLCVREASATEDVAKVAAQGHWRDELDRVRAIPNARRLLVAGGLLAVSIAATSRLLPLWARDELGVGGDRFASYTFISGALGVVLAPIGVVLGSRAHPRLLAVAAALVGAVSTGATYFVHDLTTFIVLTAVTVPLTVAAFVALAPHLVPVFPKGDRVGQAFGMAAGPIGLVTASVALSTAALVDAVDDSRVIWLVSSAALFALAVNLLGLQIAPGSRTDVRGFLRRARTAGLGPGLFDGSVDLEDVMGLGRVASPEPDEEQKAPAEPTEPTEPTEPAPA